MKFKSYIQTIPAYKPPQLTKAQPAGVVKLSSNENPLGASPMAVEAMKKALDTVYRYPDAGSALLKSKISKKYGVDPSMVLCSNGSDEMVFLLCLAFLEVGDEVVMAEGSFISYYLRTLEMNAIPVRVPLKEYTHDLNAMSAAINSKTKLVFLCNPNNPTGTINKAGEVRDFVNSIPDDVLLVVDEAYIEFVENLEYPQLLTELRNGRKNIILLRTFAKIYGLAGLRLGYAFSHPDVVTYLEKARPTFNVNSLSQVTILRLIKLFLLIWRRISYFPLRVQMRLV